MSRTIQNESILLPTYLQPSATERISIERQLQATKKYCTEKDLQLVDNLQDIGLSGYHQQNLKEDAALGSFLAAVRTGIVPTPCALVVESLDRISRAEILDALSVFTTLIKSGVELHTLSDRQIYSKDSVSDNWTQLIISLSVMARGREESQIKSDRIKAARVSKFQAGQVYASYPAWLDKEGTGSTSTYSLNTEKVQLLHRIILLYRGGSGCKRIASTLNAEGILSFTGKPWRQATITKYLQSSALLGHASTKQGLIQGVSLQ